MMKNLNTRQNISSYKPITLSIVLIMILSVFSLLLFQSAQATTSNDSAITHGVSVHTGSSPSAYFGQDERLWVVFVHEGHVYSSVSQDYGETFSSAVKVNQTPENIYSKGENRAKIVVDSENRIFVSWTKKTDGFYTGEIRFSRSIDEGMSFSPPVTVHQNLGVMGHRFDSLNINSQGIVSIAWLDKRDKFKAKQTSEKYKGISLYYAWSDDHGESFQQEVKLADHTCECCRIGSVTDAQDNLHLIWRHIYDDNIRDHALMSIDDQQQIMQFARASVDNWQTDACPHHGPDITTDNENRLYYSWFSQGTTNSGVMVGGYDQNNNEMMRVSVVDASAQASHPQILMHNGLLINVWKRFDGERTHIKARISRDDGKHWSTEKSLVSTQGASDHPLLIHTTEQAYLAWQTHDEGFRLIKVEYVD